MPFRNLFLLLMCLGLAGLSAAACGGDDDSEGIDAANQTAAAQDAEDEEDATDDEEGTPDDGGDTGGSATVFDLREGHCFNADTENSVGEVDLVDCADPHQYEVVNIFSVPDAEAFPGDEYFGDQAVEHCEPGAATYLAPSAGTWDVGDRVVICLAEG